MKSDLAISHQFAAILLFIFTSAIGLSIWLGYEIACRKHANSNTYFAVHYSTDDADRNKLLEWQKQNAQQIDVLTRHIGRIEANLIRINALGAHLVEYANLSREEFNFEQAAAVGGPYIPLEPNALLTTIKEFDRLIDIRLNQFSALNQILQFRKQRHELSFDNKGKPVNGWISSYFGPRKDPLTGEKAWHSGVDIVAKEGAPIKALAAGIVTQSAVKGAYGYLVEIDHGSGLKTRYGHNKALLVKTGELVKKGQSIALLGSSGRSTGPHVHLEVHKDGKTVDPGLYFTDLRRG